MFEDVCLVCGRHLGDDGRAYCSNDCENVDISSPSISSTSSAISSPHLGHGVGGDVPALPPFALGTAFKRHRNRDRYSISSSSASSASWSVPTDDEDEEPALGVSIENNQTDGPEHVHEVNSKSTGNGHSVWSAALSYARLPSGTNNRSTVPHVHKRTPSGSPGHVHGTPQSAPIRSHSSADDEEGYSDFAFPSRDGSDPVEICHPPHADGSGTAKSKRTRNRASLPACFSLLQVSNPAQEARYSPVSSSSGHTIARASPPTPKLVLSTGVVHAQVLAQGDAILVTPRGRRRVPGTSRTSRRSVEYSSPSPSPSRMHRNVPLPDMLTGLPTQRPEIRGVSRHTSNWSSDPCAGRGRNTFRRNISPPPKSHFDDHLNSKARARGRLRTEELDRFSPEAPGLGNGRSGLVNRERGRPTLYY
ncbi:hypothetical protein APHAL10511_001005 [Amanita phalloides]|nr:hypothetical protein APHAL10511_001005 [Amanita phalloides]